MPRELFDAEGKAYQVPDEAELQAYQEAQGKITELQNKMKELEADADPDWRGARVKMKEMERELKDWKLKAEKAGVQTEPKPLPTEDIEKIADERAEKVFLDRYRERRLAEFGDNREKVGRFFEKLAAGEKLDEAKIDDIITAAARTAGIQEENAPFRRAMASSGTSAPRFEERAKESDYSETEAGKAIAQRMGLSFPEQKK